MADPDPRLLEGVRLFNAGEFFEAHEVVEDLWNETWGEDRNLLKGFIQAAVACEHHRRGNLPGAWSVWRTARRHLAPYGTSGPYAGTAGRLDVQGLLAGLEEFFSRVDRGEEPPYPRVRLSAEAGASGGQGGSR